MTLHEQIAHLDDATAVRLLRTVSEARAAEMGETVEPSASLAAGLSDAFALGSDPLEPMNKGDLARAALAVLAEDPMVSDPLATLIDGPPTRTFGVDPGSFLLVTAALVVLQTHVRVERTTTGRWKIEIDKPSASSSVLKTLTAKLVPFLHTET